MPEQLFNREVLNVRERPLSSDLNKLQSYGAQTLREMFRCLFTTRATFGSGAHQDVPSVNEAAFCGNAFRVTEAGPVGMSVVISAGWGIFRQAVQDFNIGGIAGVDDASSLRPLEVTASGETISSIPASDPVNDRIDIIEVKVDRRYVDPTSRDILDVGTGAFLPGLVNKTLTYNQNGQSSINGSGSINYKTGTPAAVPVAPATTAGYAKISEVLIPATSTTIIQNRIKDLRQMLFPSGMLHFSCMYSVSAGPVITLLHLSAPPGITLSAFSTGPSFSTHVYVVPGDASLFASLAVMGTTNGATATGVNVTPVPVIATSVHQAAAAAGSPSIAIAIGQPIVDIFTAHPATEANTVHVSGMFQY